MLYVGLLFSGLKRQEVCKRAVCANSGNLQINEEDTCRVRLTVTNAGTNEMLSCRLMIDCRTSFGDNTRSRFSISLGAGESRNLVYEVRGKYFGEYSIGPATFSSQDVPGWLNTHAN